MPQAFADTIIATACGSSLCDIEGQNPLANIHDEQTFRVSAQMDPIIAQDFSQSTMARPAPLHLRK
jgi:hypothetical protein